MGRAEISPFVANLEVVTDAVTRLKVAAPQIEQRYRNGDYYSPSHTTRNFLFLNTDRLIEGAFTPEAPPAERVARFVGGSLLAPVALGVAIGCCATVLPGWLIYIGFFDEECNTRPEDPRPAQKELRANITAVEAALAASFKRASDLRNTSDFSSYEAQESLVNLGRELNETCTVLARTESSRLRMHRPAKNIQAYRDKFLDLLS